MIELREGRMMGERPKMAGGTDRGVPVGGTRAVNESGQSGQSGQPGHAGQPRWPGQPRGSQRVIVRGASWRREGDRRQRAARIARVLRPMAHMLGAVVSTELAVPLRGGWYRPDVGVLSDGDGLRDGVLPGPPPLVVCLGGPIPARVWLHAGADVVWALIDDTAWQLTYRRQRAVAAAEWLSHPWEPSLRLLARELTGAKARRTRISA